MITVQIPGHGTFAVPSNKINELLTWLSNNSTTVEANNQVKPGDTIING